MPTSRLKAWPLLSVFFLTGLGSAAPMVILSSKSPRPGDTLRIELEMASSARLTVFWNGKKYPLYPVGPNAQRAFIGIPLGLAPGAYPLRFAGAAGAGASLTPAPDQDIVVATRTYETEDVVFPQSKTRIFNNRIEHLEGSKIHKVLLQLHGEQYWEGRFDPPVSGGMEGRFGVLRLRNHTIHAGFHKGVDLRSPANTPVLAANGGIVALAQPFRIHGRTIIVDHGQGVMSIYLHMNSFNVSPGQHVSKGEMIGRVGSTGISTAPHIHWGIYVHGVPVDPAPWLEKEL